MTPPKRIYGIQEIYRPKDVEPEVDIVAVHGLNGEAIKTWTHGKSNTCWLSHPDFLPKYIKNARVLVWGYNSSISSLTGNNPSSDKIHHHAHTLVAELYADRKLEGMTNKPIIFLCHSLGGIVVKRALTYAAIRDSHKISHLQTIATCTHGILFFGTPHHGSAKAHLLGTLQKLAALSVPSAVARFESNLVTALELESETLQNVTDHFLPLMKNYHLHFFWEQEMTSLKYGRDYIVTEASAAPPFDDVGRSGIAADHVSMVKFADARTGPFRPVIAVLQQFCEGATDAVRRRYVVAEQRLAEERRREAREMLRSVQPVELGAEGAWGSGPRVLEEGLGGYVTIPAGQRRDLSSATR